MAKYEDIDFSPPQGVREEAAKGLEWRREYNRGGTEVGVARARDLSNGRDISPETARRMKAYFDRHEVDQQGKGWSPGEDGFPSAGRIAWALWGGDAGRSWSAKLIRQMESEDNPKNQFKAEHSMTQELCLYGPIGYPGVTARQVKEQLASFDQSGELVVRIDSEGGSVFDGLGIFDAIKAFEGPTRAVVESSAFSIASFIAMAADKVEITENGYLMLHNPWTQAEGDHAELAKQADMLAQLKQNMIAAYADKTGKSAEEIEQMMATETWLGATDAQATGLVDAVLPTAKRSVAVARFKGNMPERVQSSLNASDHPSGELADQKEKYQMSSVPKVVATAKSIKARYGNVNPAFIVAALEQELTDAEVGDKLLTDVQQENEQLKAQLAAANEKMCQMQEEVMALKAKAQEMPAPAMPEEEDEEETVVVVPAAKAKPGVAPVASVASHQPARSAKAQWEAVIADYVAKGIGKPQAAKRAIREHRELHAMVLAEANPHKS